MEIKSVVAALGIGLIAGFLLCRQYSPRIEIKEKEVSKEVIRNQIVTVTRTITAPGGGSDTTTTTTDNSTRIDTSSRSSSSTQIMAKNWTIGLYSDSAHDLGRYQAELTRNILPNLNAGILASKDAVKAGVTWSF